MHNFEKKCSHFFYRSFFLFLYRNKNHQIVFSYSSLDWYEFDCVKNNWMISWIHFGYLLLTRGRAKRVAGIKRNLISLVEIICSIAPGFVTFFFLSLYSDYFLLLGIFVISFLFHSVRHTRLGNVSEYCEIKSSFTRNLRKKEYNF